MNCNEYRVRDNEEFNSDHYPLLKDEVRKIKAGTTDICNAHKEEILICYTKYHFLKMQWLRDNQELTELVTSGALPISTIESLFAACANNTSFADQLESFLKEELK